MPWKESSVMEERLRFVARLLDGEGMSEVCRSFGISRKTGYKIFKRYKEQGVEALCDRHGLVRRARQRRRHKAHGTPLSEAIAIERIQPGRPSRTGATSACT